MATYEEIKKANDTIKTTPIRDKNYAEVPQRIKAFRMVYPNGSIVTEMTSNDGGVCVFRAVVSDGATILGTGTAYEREDSSFINKTSYIENCETSAVGRALGMAGFGIDTSIASAEEVQNAMLNQQQKTGADKITEEAKKNLMNKLNQKPKQEPIPQAEINPAPFLTENGEPKASPKQVEILREKYTGDNYKKLCYANGVSRVEDLTAAKAAELIEKLMKSGKLKGDANNGKE